MSTERVIKIISPASNEAGIYSWSEQIELLGFLEEQRDDPWLMLRGSAFNRSSFLLRSILIPERDLRGINGTPSRCGHGCAARVPWCASAMTL
jgi:hypothetical protein